MYTIDDITFTEQGLEELEKVPDDLREEVRNRSKIDALSGAKMGHDPVVTKKVIKNVRGYIESQK